MAVKVHVPIELLAHIVTYLGGDNATLRNLCLSSRALHAVSFPLLFSARDFRALGCDYLAPFLPYVHELRVSWKPDMHRNGDAEVLAKSLGPHLSPEATPRLQKLVIRGISADGMAYLNTLGDAFKGFSSLTALHLNETGHRNMRDVQVLISALPRLEHLFLNALTWISPEYNECPDGESAFLERPALKSLRVSPVYPSCMIPLLVWLGRTPSARTLQTLEVPSSARIGPDAVPHFGPSVHHLCTPIRGLRPTSLDKYTCLESLELHVGIDDFMMRQYARLPDILVALPNPAALRALTLYVPFEAVFSFPGALDVFARVDDILSSHRVQLDGSSAVPTSGQPSIGTPGQVGESKGGFDALDEVNIVLQHTRALEERDRAEADWCQRLNMPKTGELRKMSVRFEWDTSMMHSFVRGPGGFGKGMCL
ncbi:hypothetical protein GY45DRAFT_1328311 [Cubamyces sp. BRFM 1775]|nr:hypothetical protein GY45DRAFT_1328311 [Cubamyces sp. BRFM 1775]